MGWRLWDDSLIIMSNINITNWLLYMSYMIKWYMLAIILHLYDYDMIICKYEIFIINLSWGSDIRHQLYFFLFLSAVQTEQSAWFELTFDSLKCTTPDIARQPYELLSWYQKYIYKITKKLEQERKQLLQSFLQRKITF